MLYLDTERDWWEERAAFERRWRVWADVPFAAPGHLVAWVDCAKAPDACESALVTPGATPTVRAFHPRQSRMFVMPRREVLNLHTVHAVSTFAATADSTLHPELVDLIPNEHAQAFLYEEVRPWLSHLAATLGGLVLASLACLCYLCRVWSDEDPRYAEVLGVETDGSSGGDSDTDEGGRYKED